MAANRAQFVRSIAACMLLSACLPAWAGALVVFRCVDADGAVALQDTPCPQAAAQQQRTLARPPAPVAAPVAPAAVERPAASDLPAAPAAAPPARPPPLWDCVRHDGTRYESDDGIPQRQWVPLWVLGRDPRAPPSLFGDPGAPEPVPPAHGPGPPRLPPDLGLAATPGSWVVDRCHLLDDAEACRRHAARRDALRRAWRLGMPSDRAQIAPRERALSALLREACGR